MDIFTFFASTKLIDFKNISTFESLTITAHFNNVKKGLLDFKAFVTAFKLCQLSKCGM